MYTHKDIFYKIDEVREFLIDKGYNVYYIGLYGSQNYGIDTEASDLDFKAIILPSLRMLVDNSKELSKVYEFTWWQVEVKDIRNYVDSCVKVNVNFLEILSTSYYWASDESSACQFRNFFAPLLDEQGIIYLRACKGMIEQKRHALRHPFPNKIKVLEEFGYDPKQLCHIFRLRILMIRYIRWDYSFLHDGTERDLLMELKKVRHSASYVDAIVEAQLKMADSIINKYTKLPQFGAKECLIQFSRDLIYDSILHSQSICVE